MAEIKKINTELQPIDKLLDTSGDAGTSGQILSSTGSGTNWIANTGGGGTVTGTGVSSRVAYWDGTTSLTSTAGFTFNGNLAIPGYLTVTGSKIESPGAFTIDVAGQLNLDSGNSEIHLKGSGTTFGKLFVSGSDFYINNPNDNEDIIFTGIDDTASVTALTLDMSDGGTASFNNGLIIPNYIYHAGDTHTYFGFTGNDAWAMVLEGTTRLSVADSADPAFTMNAHLNMSSKDIDYVNQLHFADNVRWRDNGNDSDLNFVYGDTTFGHLRFVDGNAAFQGGIYAESGYFGTLSPDGSWAVQSSNSQTNITHKLEVQGNVDLKADNVNLDWMHADADQVLRIEIDSGNDAYFSVTGNNNFYFRTNSTTALTLDGSQNSTFAGTVTTGGRVTIIPGYSGYDQIKIASNTTANTNKLSGIYTENYEGNNVSIFQTFTQDNNNTIYYGSADNNYAGMQNHRFYVNADSDTAGSGHTQALHIASDTNATFAGNVTLNTKLIFDYGGDHYLQSGTNSLAYKTSSGTSVMSLNASTYLATFSGTILIDSVSNYTGLEVKGSGASRPSIQFSNVNQGDLGQIYGTENNALVIGTGTGSNAAVTLNSNQTVNFHNSVYFSNANVGLISWGSMGGGTGFGIRGESGRALSLGSNGAWDKLIIDTSGNATFSGQVTIPVTPTANAHAASKKYVDDSLINSTIYQGTWDANDGAGGNPDLTTNTYKTNGYYFVVSVAGDATPNDPGTTPDDWHVGDWVIYNTHTGSGAWQKIDNSSVISGAGTGQKVVKWDGSGTSETLADGPITFSTNDSTFAGDVFAAENVGHTGDTDTKMQFGDNSLLLKAGGATHLDCASDQTTHLYGGNALALSINTSQNATFAGDVTLATTKKLYLAADTYIHEHSADRFQIYVGGAEYFDLDQDELTAVLGSSTGNNKSTILGGGASVTVGDGSGNAYVGINDTSPQYGLDVNGTMQVSAAATFAGNVTIAKSTPVLTFNNLAGGGLDPILTASGTNFTISTSSITPLTIALDTGNVTFSGDVSMADGKKLQFGDGPDFEIWHAAGENTYLRETGEGATVFQSNGWYFQNTASPAVTGVHFTDAGAATFSSTLASKDLTVTSSGASTYFGNFLPSTGSGYAKFYQDSNHHMSLYMAATGGTANVVLNSSGVSYVKGGNFIIGGSSDSGELLQVEGTAAFAGAITTTGTLTVNSGHVNIDSGYSFQWGDTHERIEQSDGKIEFFTNNTQQMTLSGSSLGIGTDSPAAILEIAGSGDAIRVESTNTGAAGAQLDLLHFTTSPADDDIHGLINFGGYYTGTTSVYGSQIKSVWSDVSDRDAELQFFTNNAGTLTKALTLDTGQNATFASNIDLADWKEIHFGNSNDLRIYHNSTESHIDNYTGNLNIVNNADDGLIQFYCDNGSGGVTQYLDLNGNDGVMNAYVELRFGNGIKTKYGASQDLLIYHDGNGVIRNQTGDLYIDNYQDDGDIKFRADDMSGSNTEYFRLDGGEGETIFSRNTQHLDSVYGQFGNGKDLKIYHDGSNSFITNDTGVLYIRNNADDNDICFQSDNGTGSTATYFFLDGDNVETGFLKRTRYMDSVEARFGDGVDLKIYSDGTNGIIKNVNGSLNIIQDTDDEDINIECDNGSGGTTTYMLFDGSQTNIHTQVDFRIYDNKKLQLGNGADLEIYHDASDSFIKNSTGSLVIEQAAGAIALRPVTGENGILIVENAAVSLYYDNSKKLETVANSITSFSGGIEVTSTISGDDLTIELDHDTDNRSGTILNIGQGSYTSGKVYANDGGTWNLADADNVHTTYMVGLCIGAVFNEYRLLLNGIYDTGGHHGFTIGAPLYISGTAGELTNTAPSGSDDYVRVVGYALSTSNIYFCPDNTWVKID